MNPEQAQRILQAGRDKGADFVEIFEEETRHASVSYKDHKVESASAGTDYGIGIRLLFGTETLYAHTSKDDEEHLLRLIEALSVSRGGPGVIGLGVDDRIAPLTGVERTNRHIITLDPRKVGQERKLDLLRRADGVARKYSDKRRMKALTREDFATYQAEGG